LDCNPDHPAVNPALVVAGWGERPVAVWLDGHKAEPGKEFRAGFTRTPAECDLVLWIDRQASEPLESRLE